MYLRADHRGPAPEKEASRKRGNVRALLYKYPNSLATQAPDESPRSTILEQHLCVDTKAANTL